MARDHACAILQRDNQLSEERHSPSSRFESTGAAVKGL